MLFFSCQSKTNNTAQSNNDSDIKTVPAIIPVSDSVALPLSMEILELIKNKQYDKLASHIKDSILFSPYGYIDIANGIKFTATSLASYFYKKRDTKLNWGSYDGSGETISLTATEYFQKFVYDVDFLNAPNISLNKTLSHGNSLNNLAAVYKNSIYTEFYFPGFDKKYGGMDWRSLKLVFKRATGKLYLIAIIHDQWTS